MKFLRVLADNSTLLTALLLAVLALLTAFGLDLTKDQQTAIMGFAGALIALLAGVTTVAKRQVVTRLRPADNVAVAGPAAAEPTGTPVAVVNNDAGVPVAFATVPKAA